MKYLNILEDREMDEQVVRLIEHTRVSKLQWTCTVYNPLGAMYDDVDKPNEMEVSQSFEAETVMDGRPFFLELRESIVLPSGISDIYGSIYRDAKEPEEQREFSMSIDCDIDEDDTASKACEVYADSNIAKLADAVIPQLVDSEPVAFTYSFARFYNQKLPSKFTRLPMAKLCEKLLNEKRIGEFHQMVLSMEARAELVKEI